MEHQRFSGHSLVDFKVNKQGIEEFYQALAYLLFFRLEIKHSFKLQDLCSAAVNNTVDGNKSQLVDNNVTALNVIHIEMGIKYKETDTFCSCMVVFILVVVVLD